jgi:hypothetical protein
MYIGRVPVSGGPRGPGVQINEHNNELMIFMSSVGFESDLTCHDPKK